MRTVGAVYATDDLGAVVDAMVACRTTTVYVPLTSNRVLQNMSERHVCAMQVCGGLAGLSRGRRAAERRGAEDDPRRGGSHHENFCSFAVIATSRELPQGVLFK